MKKMNIVRTLSLWIAFVGMTYGAPIQGWGGNNKKTWIENILSLPKKPGKNQANLGIRFMVYLLDGFLIGAGVYLALSFVGPLVKPFLQKWPLVFYGVIYMVGLSVPIWFNLTDFTNHLMGLETVDARGKRVGMEVLLGRTIFRVLMGIPVFPITLLGLLTKDGRLLHDQIFDTYVVYTS